ncbi:MAG: thioredoxin family protein [Bacteroidia bacterium]|nr:thioredoxin family protein [Bacteroidia bacterium]
MLQPAWFEEKLAHSMDYAAYRSLMDRLVANGQTSGLVQTPALVQYTGLNLHRMQRIEKTTALDPGLAGQLAGLRRRYIWLTLTEAWCGDAAQSLPVIHAMAAAAHGQIDFRLIFRDEHPDLMDQFLTGGPGGTRSIPKLICLDPDRLGVLGSWGPRPAEAHALVQRLKAAQADHDEMVRQAQIWYAHDRSASIQAEFRALLQQWEAMPAT